jgi:hypothetical protein
VLLELARGVVEKLGAQGDLAEKRRERQGQYERGEEEREDGVQGIPPKRGWEYSS